MTHGDALGTGRDRGPFTGRTRRPAARVYSIPVADKAVQEPCQPPRPTNTGTSSADMVRTTFAGRTERVKSAGAACSPGDLRGPLPRQRAPQRPTRPHVLLESRGGGEARRSEDTEQRRAGDGHACHHAQTAFHRSATARCVLSLVGLDPRRGLEAPRRRPRTPPRRPARHRRRRCPIRLPRPQPPAG